MHFPSALNSCGKGPIYIINVTPGDLIRGCFREVGHCNGPTTFVFTIDLDQIFGLQ